MLGLRKFLVGLARSSTSDSTSTELTSTDLTVQRVRCSCQAESLVVFPRPWYRHQGQQTIEEACVACGKSLLPMQIPAGAVHHVYALATVPIGVAGAVSDALAAEATEAQDTPAPEVSLLPSDWSFEHDPSPAYQDWLASQPMPTPVDRSTWIRNGAATAALVAIVLLCQFF